MLRFDGLGLDSPLVDSPRDRLITLSVQGPGTVSARLSEATGEVRICLAQGRPPSLTAQTCRTARDGAVAAVAPPGATVWTVTISGGQGVDVPVTDLEITFPADEPSAELAGFRFQGIAFPEYNGFTVTLGDVQSGALDLEAAWTGGATPFRVAVQADNGQTVGEESGAGESVDFTAQLREPGGYRLELRNEVEFATADFRLSATLRWP